MSPAIEQWNVTVRESEKGPFARFPSAISPGTLNPATLLETFLKTRGSLIGSIGGDPRIVTDCRYRLVQLHEVFHVFHHRFRQQTYSALKSYLNYALKKGLLPQGRRVYGPSLLEGRPGRLSAFFHRGRTVIAQRETSHVVLEEMSESDLIVAMILSQHDELFADFFAAAAGGPGYWTTLVDFTLEATNDPKSLLESNWDVAYPEVFEPHPVAWLRMRYFPRLFGEVFGESVVVPSKAHIYKVVNDLSQHFHEIVLPRLPNIDPRAPIVYLNDRAAGSAKRIELAFETAVPFYRAAFDAFSMLMNTWTLQNDPLQAFTLFFTFQHHDRIQTLAKTIASNQPASSQPFDAAAGTGAARLAYDLKLTPDLQALQQAATAFLKNTSGAANFIPMTAR